jgi:hypothetical protein
MASIRGKGWRSGRTGKRTTFPRPGCNRSPTGPVPLARPRPVPGPAGGQEAPAGGAAGAGQGLWPPAGQEAAWRCGRGDGPCHCSGESAFVSAGGNRKRSAFPPPLRSGDPQTGRSGSNERPAPDPAGEKAPARGGASAGRGLWPPAGQGTGWRFGRGDGSCQYAQGAQAEEIPAFRSGSPCGRHFFSTLLTRGGRCFIGLSWISASVPFQGPSHRLRARA